MELSLWQTAPISVLGLGWAVWARERGRRQLAETAAARLRDAQEATLRLLRLSSGDQRTVALTLIGHAGTRQPADPALTGLARRLLDLSETLVEQTESPDAPRTIADEWLVLGDMVAFGIAQVDAHLGPSRRAWRVDPGFTGARLLADRRALNQILLSVLTAAAAATRDGDWIEISLHHSAAGADIVIEDEGVGLPLASDTHPEEGRGIGLRLTLARSLMQAQGGSLAVQSAERVGTRVRLRFTADRLAGERLPATAG